MSTAVNGSVFQQGKTISESIFVRVSIGVVNTITESNWGGKELFQLTVAARGSVNSQQEL